MTNLYIDFDGVIMDTNKAITSLLEEYNISSENNEEKLEFLSKVNWHQLLNQSNEISNAFKNIQTLAQTGIYNVSILTHVCSEHESIEKTKLIDKIKPLFYKDFKLKNKTKYHTLYITLTILICFIAITLLKL